MAATISAEIRWEDDKPAPGFTTVTGLTEDARGFLHWMATDGDLPVQGTWDGTSLVIETDGEGDYLNSVLGPQFVFEGYESNYRAEDADADADTAEC